MDVACVLCGKDEATLSAQGYDFEYDSCSNVFDFVRCNFCGHEYLNPRPVASTLDTIYPPDYYSFTGTTNRLVARIQRFWEGGKVRLYRRFLGEGRRRILDVGCGDGRFLGLLRDFGAADWEMVGLEFDQDAVATCREKGFEAHSERIEDFAQRQDRKESFDAILMLQLIEHVEDPGEICTRVETLLRPGGLFVIETPNLGGLDYRIFSGRVWGHYHFPRHWHLFSRHSLTEMLLARNFEIVHAEYLISTSSWIISHRNFFKDRGWPRPVWSFFSYQNPLLLALAVLIDTARSRLGLETSNQRMIARKKSGGRGE